MDLANFREDLKKHNEGTPIYLGDGCFYIRRWGTTESNQAIKRLRRELFGPVHDKQEMKESELFGYWLSEYGCVNWENIFDESGTEIEYSQREARRIFLNPEYQGHGGLVEQLIQQSQIWANYLFDEAMEDADLIKK